MPPSETVERRGGRRTDCVRQRLFRLRKKEHYDHGEVSKDCQSVFCTSNIHRDGGLFTKCEQGDPR